MKKILTISSLVMTAIICTSCGNNIDDSNNSVSHHEYHNKTDIKDDISDVGESIQDAIDSIEDVGEDIITDMSDIIDHDHYDNDTKIVTTE